LKAPRDPAHRKDEPTVDTSKSSVFRPNSTEEDTQPHACLNGLVFLTYTAFDEEIGGEVERIEAVPCRRCADTK
jgi:hypothetical protein